MAAKFAFFEVVRIVTDEPEFLEIVGQEGTVLGMVEDEDGHWIYAVSINDGEAWTGLYEAHLETTGKHRKREEIYSGESVRVVVDEKGRGKIVDS